MSDSRVPLKQLFPPGEYLCTWAVPDNDSGVLFLPGNVTVQPNRPPHGVIYGAIPLEWELAPGDDSFSAGFPQIVERAVLHGRLANGGPVTLVDATLMYWSGSHGRVSGRAALLGKGDAFFDAGPADLQVADRAAMDVAPLVTSIGCQIGALDAVMGVAPIASVRNPGLHPGNPKDEWTATLNSAATLEWEQDGIHLRADYIGSMRAADAFEYRLTWSPQATFTLATAVPLSEAVADYVEPLRAVVSIATGRSQPLTHFAVGVDTPPSFREVFTTGCTQDPFQSISDAVRDAGSALRAHPDGVSLLKLVRRWVELRDAHHPLVETYGAMLHASDQHPRSRYLLLVQALEGTYGHETAVAYAESTAEHSGRREAALAEARPHIAAAAYKFLARNVSKSPMRTLDDALKWMLESLPVDVTSELDGTSLVAEAKNDPKQPNSTFSALRVVRNNLAHGTRGYAPGELAETVELLEKVVRAHALRLLDVPDSIIERVLDASSV